MARAVALKLQPQSALAVVVRTSGARVIAEAVVPVPLADGETPSAIGQKIKAALAGDNAGRAATVVALPRTDLHWANYDLPPAPAAELPAMVQMQAQRDIVLADDGVGFDYVSLEGDEQHPHRVLGVGVSPGQLDRIRAICAAAELRLTRLVPEPLGWVELSRRIAAQADGGALAEVGALTVFAAMAGRQAAVWALRADELRLVRTVWLAAEPSAADDLAALAGELKRTLLSLAQNAGTPAPQLPCAYVGENAEQVAQQLAAALGRPVRSVQLEELVEVPAYDRLARLSGVPPLAHGTEPHSGPAHAELAPLAALAASMAAERSSLVDLLHPHRPPAPPSNRRRYVLAGVAAACAAAALLWSGYRRIAGPREEAAAADAERLALNPVLDRLQQVEAQAAAVDAWLNQSGNMLEELDYLSQQLRPKPLSDSAFNSGEDMMLAKLTISGRQITIDGAARTVEAMGAVERRLRDGRYRVIRGNTEGTTEATPGYAARMLDVLERIDGGEAVSTLAAGSPGAGASGPAASPAGTSASTPSAAPAPVATPPGATTTPPGATTTPPPTAADAGGEEAQGAAGSSAAPPAVGQPAVEEPTGSAAPAEPATAAPAAVPAATEASPSAVPASAPTAAPVEASAVDAFGGSP
jgi:hypothetical protein